MPPSIPPILALDSWSTFFTASLHAATIMSGSIQGSVRLMKKGSGTLILTNGANSYSGGTVLSSGVLNVGADSGGNQNDLALGTGPVTVNTFAELRFGGNTGAVVKIGRAH